MKQFILGIAALGLLSASMSATAQDAKTEVFGSGSKHFSLATGSPGELGLLKRLAETFAATNDARMTWHKAGTGQSMKLLKENKVDMVMVHAPGQEESAVAEGWAARRTLIGSNEFYIVGPAVDPAKIAEAKSAADAYRRIAAARAKFVSRGDNSGTHQKEMGVWKSAGISPDGGWYIVTRDFMTASLKRANAEGAYFMTDSSTWVASKKEVPQLTVLFRGDKALVNTYSAMLATGGTPGEAIAGRFIDFVASDAGQRIIREFGRDNYGAPLYNDADYARQYAH
jgi:tungstate transport system substrate-binding protein